MDRLQQSMSTVQKGQADVVSKMDGLEQLIQALREELRENQKKVAVLSQRMDDTQAKLGIRMDQLSQIISQSTAPAPSTESSAPLPTEYYKEAYTDYLAGKIDLAEKGFKSFIDRYPKSDLTDDALFYLADCYLTKKDYAQARLHFDKVLASSAELRAQALFKRALSLEGLKQPENQKVTLQALIKEFPTSQEAQRAKEILENFSAPAKKNKTASNSKSHKRDLE